MTAEQHRRVEQAIKETQRTLERAMRYSPEFRDAELIAFCHQHIAKLVEMQAKLVGI